MLRKAVLKLVSFVLVRLDVVKLNTANDTCNNICGTQGKKIFFRGNETDQVRNERSNEVVTSREVELERRKKIYCRDVYKYQGMPVVLGG